MIKGTILENWIENMTMNTFFGSDKSTEPKKKTRRKTKKTKKT
tara:strand:- start:104 stop:232 length:129 start_codon:yes stop_codon:yes gene_type:complete